MNLTGTVSVLELAYVVPMVLGIVVYVLLGYDSLRTLWANVVGNSSTMMRESALDEASTDVAGLGVLLAALVIGVIELLSPPSAAVTPREWWVTACLFVIPLLLVAHGVFRYRYRRILWRRIHGSVTRLPSVSVPVVAAQEDGA